MLKEINEKCNVVISILNYFYVNKNSTEEEDKSTEDLDFLN